MIFNVDKPSASGIYKITNAISGKIYIGSAFNLKKRFRVHRSLLLRGIHDNDHLQKSFNKYGNDAFTFSIMEYCDKTELDEKELQYIGQYYGEMCYNINKSIQCRDMNLRHIRTVTLISPNGISYNFCGTIKDIAKKLHDEHGFNKEEYVYHGLCRLLSEKVKHFRGWRLVKNASFDWSIPIKRKLRSKIWNVRLVSPDGVVYGPIDNLEQFCREHGVKRSSDLLNVINGHTRYNNGWHLEGTSTVAKNSRTYDVVIEDGAGNRYGPINNLTDFARSHSVSQSALRQFIVGNRTKYKNWKIIKPLENKDE